MSNLKIMDVTLRDGGHKNNFHFTQHQLGKILLSLDSIGVDFIEIGYRNGSIKSIKDIGIAGMSPNHYITFCRKHIQKAKISIMAHCQNISVHDIKDMKSLGIDLLRLCIQVESQKHAFPLIDMAKEHGLMVSANFIHASQYSEQRLFDIVETTDKYKPDLVYFADSNGCLHPDAIKRIFQYCSSKHTIQFGFHGHDNIGLAQTNTIAAIESGASFIDAALSGAGKGIGNLRLEFFLAYLNSLGLGNYDINTCCQISNFVKYELKTYDSITYGEFLRGIKDLSTKQLSKHLENLSSELL